MKKYYVFLVLTILLCSIGCSNSDDSMDPPSSNNDRTISFNGGMAIEIDTLQGQFVNTYQESATISGSFSATNFTTGQTLLLFLYDDDENSFPFTNNGVFPINSDLIRATARYTEFSGTDIQANSGSVAISEYRRIDEPNRTLFEISGTFDFTDGSESVNGRFDNIRLVLCVECSD
ncbi:hypothetical protein [Winogradskyella sp.]|uniref:hypothetical protein n=1 Tax=Winogradskyella sp. TaxID=1883156 RepID=UPI003BABE722